MAGKLAPEAFSDAKAIAARDAIKDQEVADVEVVSDGELFRRDDTLRACAGYLGHPCLNKRY